jgi:hypothetical protein
MSMYACHMRCGPRVEVRDDTRVRRKPLNMYVVYKHELVPLGTSCELFLEHRHFPQEIRNNRASLASREWSPFMRRSLLPVLCGTASV